MNREPKISEIEKLIAHFRETNREDELLAVLKSHGINKNEEEPVTVIEEGTNQFHEEGIVLNTMAKKEGLIKKGNKFWKKTRLLYKEKWYVRYSVYYLIIFIVSLVLLNAPLIFTRLNWPGGDKDDSKIITVKELEQAPMAKSAPLDAGEVIPKGSQVVIPKINVKAPIIYLDTRDEKTIQNALTKGVVHYFGTAKPGEVGNSFITGHSSNYWWIKGNYNYIFVNLDRLVVGDQAKVYYNGNKYVYQVTEKKIVSPTDTSVLAATDTPTLTLMTCTPPGTNWKRLIVKLDQVAPKYEKPRLVTKEKVINGQEKILPGGDNGTVGGLALDLWQFVKGIFN